MGSIRVIHKESGKVFDSIKAAADKYGESASYFQKKFKKGKLEGFEKYEKKEQEPMVFARHPRGRIEVTYRSASSYQGIRKIYPFGDLNALNNILEQLPYLIPMTNTRLKKHLYLKSKINN